MENIITQSREKNNVTVLEFTLDENLENLDQILEKIENLITQSPKKNNGRVRVTEFTLYQENFDRIFEKSLLIKGSIVLINLVEASDSPKGEFITLTF